MREKKYSNEYIFNIVNGNDISKIEKFLFEHSNLPGPRANLTLVYDFANYFKQHNINNGLLNMLISWCNINIEEAPVNDVKEYLPLVGIVSLGANYPYANESIRESILNQIRLAMNSERWRTREGSAMALQEIAEHDFTPVKELIVSILDDANLLEKRAIIAALAHPPILKDNREITEFCLKVSSKILDDIINMDNALFGSEDYKVLAKGLKYALSVFVAYLPKKGFEFFEIYVDKQNSEINKIIKTNLTKARIAKKFPEEVEGIKKLL